MKIQQALFAPGTSAFFFDDQRAIKDGAGHDGFFYTGAPATPHFKTVRIAGETVSILLLLEDGSLAAGDCAAVQYSGAGVNQIKMLHFSRKSHFLVYQICLNIYGNNAKIFPP